MENKLISGMSISLLVQVYHSSYAAHTVMHLRWSTLHPSRSDTALLNIHAQITLGLTVKPVLCDRFLGKQKRSFKGG